MPALLTAAALPRPGVWTAPDVRSHSLVVLAPPRLYLAPLTGDPRPETVVALEAGGSADAILGPLATAIDLAAVRRVRLDLLANTLHVEYTAGGRGKAKAAVTFATPETADAAFGKLWARLGEEFQLKPHRPDPWAVARVPVAVILSIVAATALLGLGLNALDDLAAARHWSWAGYLPAWQVVCGAGGAAAAVFSVGLYHRLTRPPDRLDLIRS
jgi:hypothetical protein